MTSYKFAFCLKQQSAVWIPFQINHMVCLQANLAKFIDLSETLFLYFPGLIKLIADDLNNFYQERYCKKQACPWKPDEFLDLDSIYVPMSLDIKVSGASSVKKRLSSYQDIFKSDQKSSRFILVGGPGQGKSVFCAKIASDWCHRTELSPLKHIQLLFILQLGVMNHESNIEDAIRSQLLSDEVDVDGETLGKLIKDLGSSVAIVLDGLDEAPPDLMKHKDTTGNLIKTIRYSYLRDCRILITTRPWREREIVRLPEYERLELQKLSRSDVKALVENFFSQGDHLAVALGKRLMQYIDKNKLLVDTSIPLVVLMICWFWMETQGKKGLPERLGELYGEILDIMYQNLPSPVTDKVGSDHRFNIPNLYPKEGALRYSGVHMHKEKTCEMLLLFFQNNF